MEKFDGDVTNHYAWLGKLIAEDRNSEESTCDLVLESEGKEFPVHKNIMMLVSKYFKKMFTIEMKEKYEGIVKMLQIPHERLANLIEFVYSGRIIITKDNVTDILDDAEYTQLEALKESCKTALIKLVCADNCLKLRAYAQRYNLDEVFVKTNQEITTSFAAVVRQDDFIQLDVDDITDVIKLRNKTCEEAVFTGILQWVNHNPLQREELFVNLFLKLDPSLMRTDFLNRASTENLVKNNLVCSNFLVQNLLQNWNNPHTTVSCTDKLLFIGGGKSLKECVVYDVITKQATQLPQLNEQRSGSTCVKVGSKVFVVGGNVGDSNKTCEMLDINEQTSWILMPKMLRARPYCSSCYFGDHIYVTGGWNNGRLSSCEKFDIHNNKWMNIKDMIHVRSEHGTVVWNGFIYCIGGFDGSKQLFSCERFDVKSDVWNEIAPLNQARCGLACVVLDGNVYAIGGLGYNGQYLSSVERLKPVLGIWENIASLQHARYCSSACVVGKKIFVIGGSNGNKDLNSVEVYDPTSNVWTIAFNTKEPVSEATVVAI